jgi:phenylalanyl-tRNA synthetase beta chain
MHISHRWLHDYLDFDLSPSKTSELLTDLGLEVEGLTSYQSIKGGLEGIIVGEVISCKQHPNADRLKVTEVNLGDQVVQIVCGAPNVAEGQKVPVATVGTLLYPTEGEPFKIKKSKIRGEESYGMICAEDEMGIGTSHDGILVLPENAEIGTPLTNLFETYEDHIYEIGLTPNRSDAMSHYGVARDLRAGLALEKTQPPLNTIPVSSFHVENTTSPIEIEVEEHELVPRYLGVVISGIEVKESPTWLKDRLKSIGLNPINNIVDVTNFILHGLGQPLHAFDYNKIKGSKVVVRKAKQGEKLLCLDEVDRELATDDLVICDTEGPMCIAGVFGGHHSGVSNTTTSIFLESAYFDAVSIRKTAKRHGLNTDASFRFERGIDIEFCEIALKRAAILIREVAGGVISSEISSFYPKEKESIQLFLNYEKLNTILGHEIENEKIKSILVSLDFRILNETESGLGLIAPLYRVDVTREIDVVEEILRVYGYNHIPIPQKLTSTLNRSKSSSNLQNQNRVADFLVSLGYNEILTNSLVSLSSNQSEQSVALKNPLSKELEVLRDHMIGTTLQSVAFNLNRQRSDIKFFEFGKTYFKKGKEFEEKRELILAVTGSRYPENWMQTKSATSFFDIKTVSLELLRRLGIYDLQESPLDNEHAFFAEGLIIESNGQRVAELGLVQESHLENYDIDQSVFASIIYWDKVLTLSDQKEGERLYIPIAKYPAVRRDLALLLDDHVLFSEIREVCFESESKLLKNVNLFDVYKGKSLDSDKKSYGISLILSDSEKTLTDKQVDKAMEHIVNNLQEKFDCSLR